MNATLHYPLVERPYSNTKPSFRLYTIAEEELFCKHNEKHYRIDMSNFFLNKENGASKDGTPGKIIDQVMKNKAGNMELMIDCEQPILADKTRKRGVYYCVLIVNDKKVTIAAKIQKRRSKQVIVSDCNNSKYVSLSDIESEIIYMSQNEPNLYAGHYQVYCPMSKCHFTILFMAMFDNSLHLMMLEDMQCMPKLFEEKYMALIAQAVLCNLRFAQIESGLCHNDLKTDNIVANETAHTRMFVVLDPFYFVFFGSDDDEKLFIDNCKHFLAQFNLSEVHLKCFYSIPTFGQQTNMIDFGMSMFSIKKNQQKCDSGTWVVYVNESNHKIAAPFMNLKTDEKRVMATSVTASGLMDDGYNIHSKDNDISLLFNSLLSFVIKNEPIMKLVTKTSWGMLLDQQENLNSPMIVKLMKHWYNDHEPNMSLIKKWNTKMYIEMSIARTGSDSMGWFIENWCGRYKVII